MRYEDTLTYLYTSLPVYQHIGSAAYKPGIETSEELNDRLGNPHRTYRTIHVGGTNGKGSVCHLLAAILRQAGYNVGLYTSPHLLDFRERIRVNGEMIPKEYVTDFVANNRIAFEPYKPSFFEFVSTMAFDYFRHRKVDIAVIEVGLGGRLDSTNVITPIISVITSISLDHTYFLGDTEEKIAAEKAGIIKPGVPVVIGEGNTESVYQVFKEKSAALHAPIYFAGDADADISECLLREDSVYLLNSGFGLIEGELQGEAQLQNAKTVLTVIRQLRKRNLTIPDEAVRYGFAHVVGLTGLMGRWQEINTGPAVICDTGHNVGAWKHISHLLGDEAAKRKRLYMIVGMVNDKDIDGVLSLMPKNAFYIFTQAAIERAMPAKEFARKAEEHGLKGMVCDTVAESVRLALDKANDEDDMIFIGGSTFIVAEAFPCFKNKSNKY